MHQIFLNAAFSEPPEVMGVRLVPFTLAHAFMLLAFSSPLATNPNGNIALKDLALAVWICSRPSWPFGAVNSAVRSNEGQRQLKALGKQVGAQFDADVAAMREYLDVAQKMPERFLSDKEVSGSFAAPWPFAVADQLMPTLGESRTWTAPLALILSYKVARDTNAGDKSWKSEQEETLYPSGTEG